jgi:DNA-binding response OmpR family regulator
VKVLVYSDDRRIRDDVTRALGTKPAPDLPDLEFIEAATFEYAIALLDAGGLGLVIADGEAAPAGGMGLARQAKDEIFNCPPFVVLIARRADAWLATWSRAEAVVGLRVEPFSLVNALRRALGSPESVVPPKNELESANSGSEGP